MTTLFTTTLETALTGTNGFTSVGANPTLDTASTIKGAQCARWNAATAGVGTLQPASDQNEIYFSFYVKFNAHAAAPRFFRSVDSVGATSINLTINSTSTPTIKLRNGGTTIGTSTTQLTAGTIYRIGVHIKKNSTTGATDGVAELFIATGDTAFSSAAVTSSTQIIDNPIDKIEVGPTNSVSLDCWMDDLIWSDSAMPAASGGGAFPAGPTGLTATVASATSVNLIWIDNATNEANYTVERATNSSGPWTTLTSTLAANTTTYTATSLTTSTLYYFRVKATNASGSSAYSAIASATPLSIGNWNWTEFAWPYRERYQPIILAATAGIGYVALTSDDPTNPSATYTYYSGPLNGETLTAVANETAARAAAVALPASGRWMLPSVLEARAVRLWHRHTSAYTIREFYPFRVVEADQVSAQFIRGMYLSGRQLVVDQLSALTAYLGTVTAGTFRTADSGARTVMTSDPYGGLVTYDADDNFDTTTGVGSYQVWMSKNDGKLYAGGGAVTLDATGLWLTSNNAATSAIQWRSALLTSGSLFSYVSGGLGIISMNGNPYGAYSGGRIDLYATDALGSSNYTSIILKSNGGSNTIDIGNATNPTTTTIHGGITIDANGPRYDGIILTLVNNAAAAIGVGSANFGFLFVHGNGIAAIYAVNGGVHTTTELSDPSNIYSTTAGTAASINIYWSVANNRYEVENKRGSTINVRIWYLEAA